MFKWCQWCRLWCLWWIGVMSMMDLLRPQSVCRVGFLVHKKNAFVWISGSRPVWRHLGKTNVFRSLVQGMFHILAVPKFQSDPFHPSLPAAGVEGWQLEDYRFGSWERSDGGYLGVSKLWLLRLGIYCYDLLMTRVVSWKCPEYCRIFKWPEGEDKGI